MRKALVTCHNCGSDAVSIFHDVGGVPVHSCLLMPTREVALGYPRGEIRLGFCRSCGFIANMGFDPEALEYSASYEETQGFSPRFRAFAREMACGLGACLGCVVETRRGMQTSCVQGPVFDMDDVLW